MRPAANSLKAKLRQVFVAVWERIKKQWSRYQERLHHLFPNAIPSAYDDGDYFRNTDPEENKKTCLPQGESLKVLCFWGAELYGPAEIESLYARLQSLGWDKDSMTGDRSAVRWIRDQRMYGSSGNYNIGVAAREADKRWLRVHSIKRLPEEFDHVKAIVFQLSPSLTCMLVGFALTEPAAEVYENEVRRIRTTTRRRTWGQSGYRIHRPVHLKQEALQAGRTKLRTLVVKWFEAEMPGLFCGSTDGNRLPTTELVMTEQQLPFPSAEESSGQTPAWLPIASLESPYVTWVSEECPSFRFAEQKFEGDERHHIIAAIRASDLTSEKLKYHGDPSRSTFTTYCQERLDGILSHLAAVALLSEMRRSFGTRREMVRPTAESRRRVQQTLRELEDFFRSSIGFAAVASEIADVSKQDHIFRWQCSGFVSQELHPRDQDSVPLSKSIQSRTSWLANKVLSEESLTREVLEQFSTIMSTRESVKSQARMEMLTVATVVLAVVSAVLAHAALRT